MHAALFGEPAYQPKPPLSEPPKLLSVYPHQRLVLIVRLPVKFVYKNSILRLYYVCNRCILWASEKKTAPAVLAHPGARTTGRQPYGQKKCTAGHRTERGAENNSL